MSHNPYLPPAAPLEGQADQRPRATRPRVVNVALVLVVTGIVIGAFVRGVSLFGSSAGAPMIAAIAWGLAVPALTLWLCFHVARRRNWARHALLVLVALQLLVLVRMLVASYEQQPFDAKNAFALALEVTIVLPYVLQVAALILLFGPARAWFQRSG